MNNYRYNIAKFAPESNLSLACVIYGLSNAWLILAWYRGFYVLFS